MSVSIRTDVKDLQRLGRRTKAFLHGISDTKPLMSGIGDVLLLSIDRRYEDEKGPDGEPWAATIRGGQILSLSGGLRQSYDKAYTATEVSAGTNKIQAKVHQFGATIKPKNAKVLAFTIGGNVVFARKVTIKARPAVGINDEDIRLIRGEVADFIRVHRNAARGVR